MVVVSSYYVIFDSIPERTKNFYLFTSNKYIAVDKTDKSKYNV